MKILPFKFSQEASIGVELEIQIINPRTFSLVSRAKELIRMIKASHYYERITPEITQSMLEINSSIHRSSYDLMNELYEISNYLHTLANALNVSFCGGGTHPFYKWKAQKIFPSSRYKKLSRIYSFLSKRATLFGLHIHIGCLNGNDAIYLTHALARYVPQFIALSASSPFYQGIDTSYFSARSIMFTGLPSMGVIPYLPNWEAFSNYFYKMKNVKIIESMKDMYWDIRPKPEFGTVEIRVCDMPLDIKKAIQMAAYIQTLSLCLLYEKTMPIEKDFYDFYAYNRFQASRYGYLGHIIDPCTLVTSLIGDDIVATIKKMERYGNQSNNMIWISQLLDDVLNQKNHASELRKMFKETGSLAKVVKAQCDLWEKRDALYDK